MFSCREVRLFPDFTPLLTLEDLLIIASQGKAKAKKLLSAFRHDNRGRRQPVQVSMAIVEKNESIPSTFHKSLDVNPSSEESAKRLAHKSLLLSRDDKAVSSRASNSAPGSVPLYKSINGETFLVGAIGVSGDHPDRNEAIALEASKGYEAPENIKAGNFVTSEPIQDIVLENDLPRFESNIPDLSGSVLKSPELLFEGTLPPITPTASLSSSETLKALPETPSFKSIIKTEKSFPPSPKTNLSSSAKLPELSNVPVISKLPPSPKAVKSSLPPLSSLNRL